MRKFIFLSRAVTSWCNPRLHHVRRALGLLGAVGLGFLAIFSLLDRLPVGDAWAQVPADTGAAAMPAATIRILPPFTSTVTVTITATATLTDTLTPTPTDTPAETPSDTATPTVTETPADTVTATDTATPTVTDTAVPTVTDTPTATETMEPTVTDTITATVTDTPAATNTMEPTATDTAIPTATDTPAVTDTIEPTATETFTTTPIPTPTYTPTMRPTPTRSPLIFLPILRRNLLALYDGFEQGWGSWIHGGSLGTSIQSVSGHAGSPSRVAVLGDPARDPCSEPPPNGTGYAEHAITLPPAGSGHATLSFWFQYTSYDTTVDYFYVNIIDAAGVSRPVMTPYNFTNGPLTCNVTPPPSSGWRYVQTSLDGWQLSGSTTVTLQFMTLNGDFDRGSLNTWTYVDDVQVSVDP